MRPFRQPDIFRPCPRKQYGAALMVMLVIMIVGTAVILVSSLASSAIKIERDKTTANALAQAKEALIGRALADGNRPGSLPCPDTDDDGSAEPLSGDECPNYTGRLPWRTLRLPDLRDGAGERLWYALSQNFHDDNSIHINSETQGTLAMSGSSSASQVIAIVFSPRQVLNGSSRSPSVTAACSSLKNSPTVAQSFCATNYLEGNNAALNVSAVPATPNLNYQSAGTSSTFNDRMIFITHKDLMPLVEKRIAREVKSCLDDYASAHSSTYPWAAPVSDTTNYAGTTNTLFGRLPTSSPNSSVVQHLFILLAALQLALNNYSADPSNTIKITALQTAGATLQTYALAQTPATAAPLDQASLNQAANAGDSAQTPHTPAASASATDVAQFVTTVQGQITQAYTFFASPNHGNVTSAGTTLSWPNCTLLSTPYTYWPDWRDMVFYQIAAGYAPGGGVNCGASCLTITGSGNTVAGSGSYRAAVVVAGKILSGTRTPSSITNYLEGTQANRTDPPSSTIFDTYKTFDASYPTVNDLVLCLDGSVNCK